MISQTQLIQLPVYYSSILVTLPTFWRIRKPWRTMWRHAIIYIQIGAHQRILTNSIHICVQYILICYEYLTHINSMWRETQSLRYSNERRYKAWWHVLCKLSLHPTKMGVSLVLSITAMAALSAETYHLTSGQRWGMMTVTRLKVDKYKKMT